MTEEKYTEDYVIGVVQNSLQSEINFEVERAMKPARDFVKGCLLVITAGMVAGIVVSLVNNSTSMMPAVIVHAAALVWLLPPFFKLRKRTIIVEVRRVELEDDQEGDLTLFIKKTNKY